MLKLLLGVPFPLLIDTLPAPETAKPLKSLQRAGIVQTSKPLWALICIVRLRLRIIQRERLLCSGFHLHGYSLENCRPTLR